MKKKGVEGRMKRRERVEKTQRRFQKSGGYIVFF